MPQWLPLEERKRSGANGASSRLSGDASGSSANGATQRNAVSILIGGVTSFTGTSHGCRHASAYAPLYPYSPATLAAGITTATSATNATRLPASRIPPVLRSPWTNR